MRGEADKGPLEQGSEKYPQGEDRGTSKTKAGGTVCLSVSRSILESGVYVLGEGERGPDMPCGMGIIYRRP